MVRDVNFAVLLGTFSAGANLLLADPAFAQEVKWDALPLMKLEMLYRGPLRDTVVQRWRDPADGTVCYLFIPINAQHSPANETGYVQYGPNTIGSISCVAPPITPKQAPSASSPKATPGARPRSAVPDKPSSGLGMPPASQPLPQPKPSGNQ